MILHVPQVLTQTQVREMRLALDSSEWTDGKNTVGEQGAKVKKNRQLPETSALGLELGKTILAALKTNPLFFAAALPLKFVPPLFNIYEGGENYGLHIDGSVRSIPGSGPGGESLRTDVSCTLFLSEPDDYVGGELTVVDTYGEHEIKLPAGDLILYPATSRHRVMPVTKGARVCSFFWVQSMIRDDMRRAMLFELDQAVQGVRASLGDNDHTVTLAGHYHNLLRLWAEV